MNDEEKEEDHTNKKWNRSNLCWQEIYFPSGTLQGFKPSVFQVMHKYYRTKSIEESVEWAKRVQAREAGFVLWGRQYDTLNDIAKAFGLNTGSLRVRVAGGKALAATVSEMLEKDTILFRGREYAGIASLAAAYGHDSALISDRLIYGVTRHFIVDEKSILFSTVSTPLRHLHFADRTLLSTKLCSQIKIFRLELCVQ